MPGPIAYIDRTRRYYRTLGYDRAYEWARFDTTPFHLLKRQLSEAKVGIITTASPFKPENGDQGPGAPYNASAKFYQVFSADCDPVPDLRISHVAIDRDHTSAVDMRTWFPLEALQMAQKDNRIGAVSDQFFGLPTNRSIRHTLNVDCPDLVARCQDAGLDAALLVPNCPVCHQSVSLAARSLEEAGISTVIMGCALDIVERVGVPRFLFSDFPLGNSCGRPLDPASQKTTLELALSLLEDATGPRVTRRSPLVWAATDDWKQDYSNPSNLTAKQIASLREKFDADKAISKTLREQN